MSDSQQTTRPRIRVLVRQSMLLLALSVTLMLAFVGAAHATTTPILFQGTVTNAATVLPIAGVEVRAEFWDTVEMLWFDAGSTLTGVDGSYFLPNVMGRAMGTYNLRFIAPVIYGYPDTWMFQDWDGVNPTLVDLELGEASVIASGTITDGATNVPLAGAKILAWVNTAGEGADPLWSQIASSTSSVDGTYTVRDIYTQGAGEYRFSVTAPVAPQYESYLPQDIIRNWDGSSPLALNFKLLPAAPLAAGTIRDHVTSAVFSGAHVDAYAHVSGPEGWTWEWTGSAESGYDGLFAVKDLLGYSAGDYRFVFSAPDGPAFSVYERKTIALSWDGGAPISLDATLAAVIATGAVTDSSNEMPVSGALVSLEHNIGYWAAVGTMLTGETGEFSFLDLAGRGAGDYRVTVTKSGYGRRSMIRSWNATQTMSVVSTLPPLRDDAYEIDNVPEDASNIGTSGAPQSHTTYGYGDVDYATFRAEAGAQYTVSTFDQFGPMDTKMSLYADGQKVAENDDANGQFAEIVWRASSDATMHVRVEAFDPTWYGFYGLSVSESGHAPVANDDLATCAENTSVTIDVLSNDTDEDNNTLVAHKIDDPQHGVVTFATVGFVYTPQPGWYGTDTFTYKANDGALDSGVARVTVTVTPVAQSTRLTLTTGSMSFATQAQTYACSGNLMSADAAVGSASVMLMQSTTANGTYVAVPGKVAMTTPSGTFTITGIKPLEKTWYKVLFVGISNEYAGAESGVVYVLPQADVGNPVAPATMYASRAKTVYGYIKPKHSGSPVRIYKYRYVSGKWKAYGYTTAKAVYYASSTTTKYSALIKLPYRGKWRLRSYHPADAGHAASWSSGYDYVTVR